MPNKASTDSLSATDNVISTLMKIWATKPVYDFKQIFGLVLEWGPLREDFEESKYVHPVLLKCLIEYVAPSSAYIYMLRLFNISMRTFSNPEMVLDNGERVRLYISYIIGLLSKPILVKNESMHHLIGSSWNVVKSTFSDAFNKALKELNDTQMRMIEKIIENGDWPVAEEKKE